MSYILAILFLVVFVVPLFFLSTIAKTIVGLKRSKFHTYNLRKLSDDDMACHKVYTYILERIG